MRSIVIASVASLIVWGVLTQPSSALPIATAEGGSVVGGQARKTVTANSFPGADLGAKINAADKALGSTAGEILVRDGGVISTQVILNSGHSLRFGAGTYRLETQLHDQGAFLLNSRTSVTGSGSENTIIVEPRQVGWIVFQSYADANSKPTHSGTDSDISISNLQIRGANPKVDGGVRQTLNLGNCRRCTVERVWLNATGVIGVQAGGNGFGGNFAENVTIRNNLFTHVASQAAAVVNGRNIVIDGNTFKDSGRDPGQGMTAIDVEPNVNNDIAQNIQITNNIIDSTNSTYLHGNGILVQNSGGTANFGPVVVKGNTVIGGQLLPNIGGMIAIGIYISGLTQNVTVTNNTVRRVSHSGIRLENSTRNYVANNTLISTGTGGIFAFEIIKTTDSQIIDNIVKVDPNSPMGNTAIIEIGACRNNVYRGNTDGQNRIVPSLSR